MNDKLRVLLIDDVNDYISYPVLRADQLVIFHIDSWTKAQFMLGAQTEPIEPDIILIDINFQDDQSAPRWKAIEGEPDYGDKKPTGLFIGLAFSGMLYQSGLPRIGSIYSADPGLFRGDPAARTAAALLDMTINRPDKLWTQLSIDNWFDSLNLGSDPHHACRAAIIKLREKIIKWCQGELTARLAVTPASHWRVESALQKLSNSESCESEELALEFLTIPGSTRRLNLASIFADSDLARSINSAREFLAQISYFPALLKECLGYAEKVENGTRLTAIVPETKPLARLVVMLLLLLKWWKHRPEEWRVELNYAWDLDNNCPLLKPGVSLKSYLKRFVNALAEYKEIDISDLQNSSQYIEAYLLSKSAQYAIFNRKVINELLIMAASIGCLKKVKDHHCQVLPSKLEREDKIDHWRPDHSGMKFLQQDFLDSLQMQTNQFQRIIQEVNRTCGLSLPIYWENHWKGNGELKLPGFLRAILQDYVKEHLNWTIENEWPSWLRNS